MPKPFQIRQHDRNHKKQTNRPAVGDHPEDIKQTASKMKNAAILGILRHIFGFAAAMLVTRGVMDGTETEALIGALMGIATVGLSVWDKAKIQKKKDALVAQIEDAGAGPPVAILLAFALVTWIFFAPIASAGEKAVIEETPVVFPEPTGFFIDGYTSGLFPTGANTPDPLDLEGSFSTGGGAAFGYRFNKVVALQLSGEIFRADSVWIESYMLTIHAYLPSEANPNFLSGLISVPDIAGSKFYLIAAGGAQRYDGNWNSLVQGGIGVEMPISENFGGAWYFLEGLYNLPGIATSDAPLDPYVTARTGIRLKF